MTRFLTHAGISLAARRACGLTVSQPTQSPSTNIGRYTLMGDLNPFSGFRAPATGG
jgi:hypothetical protein